MNDKILAVTDASFEADVINSSQAVLVDFWAEWCGPCKALAPVLDEIADEYDGKVTIAKVNVDENDQTLTDDTPVFDKTETGKRFEDFKL